MKRRAFLLTMAAAILASCRAALTPTAPREAAPASAGPTATMTPPPTAPPTQTATATTAPTATTPPLRVEGLSGVGYRLPLVTRHATDTRASLFFELAQPAAGALLLWPEDNPGAQQVIPLEEGTARHHLTVERLAPDTTYRAAVGLGQTEGFAAPHFLNEPWGEVSFRTPGDYPWRIGVIGDAGFGDSTTYALVERLAAENLDFLLHTGDVVYKLEENASPLAGWHQKWFLPFAPALKAMPVYPVPGNHDYDTVARVGESIIYYDVIPPLAPGSEANSQYYALELGDVQFLFLDSQVIFGQPGRAPQDEWLTQRLADPRFRVTVPIFHVAAYTSGRRTNSDSIPVRQTWGEQFRAAGVPLAFSGHDHNYERLIIGESTFVVSGGGSSTIYGLDTLLEGSQVFEATSHIVLLEMHADRVSLRAISAAGETLDEAEVPLG